MKTNVLLAYAFLAIDSTIMMTNRQRFAYNMKNLGIDAAQSGTLQTAFGVAQLVGGFLFGQMCDTFGLRRCMTLVALSGCACYWLSAYAYDFYTLLAAMLAAMFAQGLLGTQTILAKSTSDEERTTAFGRFALIFSLGAVAGPILSGALGDVSNSVLCTGAGFIYLMFAPVFYTVFSDPARDVKDHVQGQKSAFDSAIVKHVLQQPAVVPLLAVRALTMGAFFAFDSVFALHLIDRFHMTTQDNSWFGLYRGILLTAMNAVGMPLFRKRFSNAAMLRIGCVALLYAFLSLSLFYKFWHIYLIIPGFTVGISLVRTVADALLTQVVGPKESGTVLGISYAAISASMALAPAISGYLMRSYGFHTIGMLGLSIAGLTLAIVLNLPALDHKHAD